MSEASLFFVIVNRGKANDLLHKARDKGVQGGTVMLGEGTVQSKWLEALGINQTHKEVLVMAVPDSVSERIYSMLRDEFQLHKRFRGIAFSVPYREWRPDTAAKAAAYDYSNLPPYLCLLTVVERGLGVDCMAVAKEAGAQGGTIIHARGAGTQQEFYVPIMVEPQKDMVLIVSPRASASAIRAAIYTRMGFDEPGKGVVFALPVLSTVGLYEERKQEARA